MKELLEAFRKEMINNLMLILNEATLETIKSNDKFKHNLSDEQLNNLINYDPILYKSKTANSSVIQWLVNHYENVKDLDSNFVRSILSKFISFAKSGKVTNINPEFIKNPNDISQYRSFAGIEQAVNQTDAKEFNSEILYFDFENANSNRREDWAEDIYNRLYSKDGNQLEQIENFGLQNDLKKIYSGKDCDVWQPLTWKGSVVIGRGSGMSVCIADSSTSIYFDQYMDNGLLFYVINKKDDSGNYAISFRNNRAREIKSRSEENYEYVKNKTLYLATNSYESLIEIENKEDKPQFVYLFFNKMFPELLKIKDQSFRVSLYLCFDEKEKGEGGLDFLKIQLISMPDDYNILKQKADENDVEIDNSIAKNLFYEALSKSYKNHNKPIQVNIAKELYKNYKITGPIRGLLSQVVTHSDDKDIIKILAKHGDKVSHYAFKELIRKNKFDLAEFLIKNDLITTQCKSNLNSLAFDYVFGYQIDESSNGQKAIEFFLRNIPINDRSLSDILICCARFDQEKIFRKYVKKINDKKYLFDMIFANDDRLKMSKENKTKYLHMIIDAGFTIKDVEFKDF